MVTARGNPDPAASLQLEAASMAAALGDHASDADRGPRLCFHLQKDSDNTQRLIGVLERLGGFDAGQQVVLVWDGLPALARDLPLGYVEPVWLIERPSMGLLRR